MTTVKSNEVLAIYDYFPINTATELKFYKGDKITVFGQYDDDWWKGSIGKQVGMFPANYVVGLERLTVEQSDEEPDPDRNDWQDEEYFDSYNTLAIHHQMLTDVARTMAYKNAITALTPYIAGKAVLDVGCGTGILSIFCAKAGAAHVYAVDASDMITMATRSIVETNNLSDKITLLQGKIEELELPVDKVDVIVSEWMGSYLICESMIESVLYARDKFMDSKTGLMMPSRGDIVLAPITQPHIMEKYIDYWTDVYGVNMTCVQDLATSHFLERASCDRVVEAKHLLADSVVLRSIDMRTAQIDELEEHNATFVFQVTCTGILHGFASWFDVFFDGPDDTIAPVKLSCSPMEPTTHWKQITMLFKQAFAVVEGQHITGNIITKRNAIFRRHFNVTLRIVIHTVACAQQCEDDALGCVSYAQSYNLWR